MTDLEFQSHSTPSESFQALAISAMLAIASFIIHDQGAGECRLATVRI
jgi:hypothetical protein